ncbi:MAG: hypothetical protein DI629_03475 [Mesorhizobium amorphae]|nr:MAG: hypothetical protein DI629_03475 [Mesorhizobium amorphae]
MVALAKARNTPSRLNAVSEVPVKAGARIFQGALVAIGADGFAVPMSTATTLKGIGRAEAAADNTAGANGAISVRVDRGVFRWANSASADLITRADITNPCYGVDDQTVAKTTGSNTRSIAGTIYDVDDQGVWVRHG